MYEAPTERCDALDWPIAPLRFAVGQNSDLAAAMAALVSGPGTIE